MKIPSTAFPLFVVVSIAVLAQPATPPRGEPRPKQIFADAAPVGTHDDLRKVSLPNTTIESVAVDPTDGSCRVTAIVTHPPARDRVKVWIALPMKNWNGRFQGNGGGGFSGGNPDSLRGPVAQGFAAGATDTGHEGGSGSFALNANGRLNWQEIRDFAYLGIHDMTVVGKALTQAFYGKPPRYSYFVGGSTGGRQGLMEAQRFPEDYDGIIARCPAVNWQYLTANSMWPQVVMLEAKNFVPKAKLDAVTAAAVAACDGADGVVDGVIDDPMRCTWDPKAFVGTKVGDDIFTEADAGVVRKIWDGPRGHDGKPLWYGLLRGASLFGLAGTAGTPLVGKPFGAGLDRFRYLLAQNPKWDWTTLTRDELELFANESVELYGAVLGSDDPDLARFRDHGGKVIILHGLADQLLPPQGTIAYYERVQRAMGGAARTAEFARLFLVPGVDHGFRGAGPSPTGLMTAIINWVEEGKAPDRLFAESRDEAGNVKRSRPLFPHPQFAKYAGHGSTDDAANFISTAPDR
ncbi:MAG: tannase/feruloyl esterase family alpha/beta hydrolase [Verrucomicrobia bacterium]|nr:tannase/feruloyl esterase family alpha/beta hydrolase [Verrucomicrobiota bacterium]